MLALRAAEEKNLHAFRWANDGHSHAVIPIESAMELLAKAANQNELNKLLPEPRALTPFDLQNQKSTEPQPSPAAP
jgi:hypothetical protein